MIHTSSQNGFLIAVIVGVIVIAMFKSRRTQSGRVGPGWWVGLVFLLVILSVVFGFISWSSHGVTEERFKPVPSMIAQRARGEIQAAAQQVKDSIQEAKEQLQEAFDFSAKREKDRTRGKVIVHSPPPPLPPTRDTQYLVVEEQNGSTKQETVRKRVLQKAVQSIDEWVAARLPTKAYYVWNNLDPAKLELSEDKVDLDHNEVNLPDGEKQTLYTGSYKVELTPKMQEDLLSTAYSDIERGLAHQTLVTQGVFFIVIAGITIFAALLGLLRYYTWWSRNKLAALQTASSN